MIIPFPPGGVYDAVGRPWAEKVKPLLGTVVVENQGGAGGSLGANAVARATPDGYTLLLGGIGPLVINPLATSRTPYDPIKDFDPIGILIVTPFAVAVNPNVPATTLAEFIAYARRNPGKLSYGSAGVGSGNHLTGELLKSLTGIDIVHVPYRGAGPSLNDVIGGQIDAAVVNITGQVLELRRAGRLRLLAVSSSQRLTTVPDVPSAPEAGVPDFLSRNFIGVYVPAATPAGIIAQLVQANRAAMADRELMQLFLAAGFEPNMDLDPAQARRFLQEEIARWTPVIRSIGLKLD
jgi:tripartite-type tricarboxylate transporter receptor subunit TctC